ncbi:hypothetical protein QN345_09075 [Cryobacterium sp. 10I1]|uniref:hypothetical protein n=1 Tax=unclassified Cryobacterium TaxID=2649013 RepID=UPI002B235AF4|nr:MULTISPECIES: hypothetical protein [unclassified Cryobacterium]MEB0003824.1 hypothetical protein [Cryobacterium sp. RTC2.1]MEB0305466.1 hypothetical protein [Cryobacterium sp. 10I1]
MTARDRRVKRLAFTCLVILAIGMTFMLAYGVAAGIWWNDSSFSTCTVNAASHHDTYGKSGFLGVVYDVDTTCGLLQVTGGRVLSEKEAETLGQSIRSGNEYLFELRGWTGWPNARRAIVTANDSTRP